MLISATVTVTACGLLQLFPYLASMGCIQIEARPAVCSCALRPGHSYSAASSSLERRTNLDGTSTATTFNLV